VPETWAVIMAGGVGSRFWPLSRQTRPKQLLPVVGERSLLEETWRRVAPLVPPERVLVVTGRAHAGAVREVLAELPPEAVLVEPVGRNTAPCIGLAAAHVAATSPEAVLLVLPADHFVSDREAFSADARTAIDLAAGGRLVTFGVPPTRPETGYGYLEVGEALPGGGSLVAGFTEKPDTATAAEYLAGGRHLWNSGIFVFAAGRILAELERHLPDHAAALRRIQAARGSAREADVLEAEFSALEPISIDYGVMERADDIAVVRASFPWSDVGHWAALRELLASEEGASIHRGEVVEADGRGNVLVADRGLVAVVGMKDTVVVHAGDAVLVCPVGRSQDVRAVVDTLRRRGLEDYL